MKDFVLLTDLPITKESCDSLIKRKFKRKQIISESADFLYMKADGSGFEIDFTPNDTLSDPNCMMMAEDIENCPNKNAYLTSVSATTDYVIVKLVEILKPLYGKMWIIDDESNIFNSADDFIKRFN